MFRGLYSAATAMEYLERQHQVTASNLAHLNTAGHRRGVFSVSEMTNSSENVEARPGASANGNIDFRTPGRIQRTNRSLDLAIRGNGFFQFQGENETVYSKNGILFRDSEGQLRNRDGLALIGEDGPIVIPPNIGDQSIVFGSDGTISANGDEIGKVALVEFDDTSLLGGQSQTEFLIGDAVATPAVESVIEQGSHELSNVQAVNELVNLIVSSRHFEAAQRAIRTISESIQQNIQQ